MRIRASLLHMTTHLASWHPMHRRIDWSSTVELRCFGRLRQRHRRVSICHAGVETTVAWAPWHDIERGVCLFVHGASSERADIKARSYPRVNGDKIAGNVDISISSRRPLEHGLPHLLPPRLFSAGESGTSSLTVHYAVRAPGPILDGTYSGSILRRQDKLYALSLDVKPQEGGCGIAPSCIP